MINECNSANLDREMVFYCASSIVDHRAYVARVHKLVKKTLVVAACTRSAFSLSFLLREESGIGIFDRTDSSLVQVAVLLFSVELSLVTKVIEIRSSSPPYPKPSFSFFLFLNVHLI